MSTHRSKQLRAAALLFMAAVVAVSFWLSNVLLAAAGLLTGLLFLLAVRSGAGPAGTGALNKGRQS